MNIILASQSPRRQQLLEWAEIEFKIIVKHTNEDFPSKLAIEEVPVYIASEKAKAVNDYILAECPGEYKNPVILAADTVVVLNGEIIGKPENRLDAIEILTKLSGRTHRVITGVAILSGGREIKFNDITEVCFHELTQQQVIHYVDNYKPYDKAGAYAIQEWIGVIGIKSINGDFYNVMGLPVSRVVRELVKFLATLEVT